ncbi:phosphoribosylglycinamide synthetase [Xylariaceae sp. FL0594]|nr:phosphoribosylglycinamide synthetase [Xylariaceae sp. FL0594]
MDDNLRILLLGAGGREHAIAWSLAQSPRVEKVICIPGNGATAYKLAKVENAPQTISANNFGELVKFAKDNAINLVVPGTEKYIVGGIERCFKDAGVAVFGPSEEAARLEGSKCFAKEFMTRHSIPTAKYWNCYSLEDARRALGQTDFPIVVKASGLAGGKGVLMPNGADENLSAVKTIMCDRVFGDAGNEIVIEERLYGDEISITFVTDGRSLRLFPVGQDAQRIRDGNEGANTGGMGVYAPTAILDDGQIKSIIKNILEPSVKGISDEGHMFIGFICVGLMMTSSGPRLIEFNARFGDPEAQTLLPMMDDKSDLAEIMMACVHQRLHQVHLGFKPGFSVSIVLASKGYPGDYEIGKKISIEPTSKGGEVLMFHAGTVLDGDSLKTNGGRVLAVVALAETLEDAAKCAYEGVKRIRFDGMYFRTDIGKLKP